MATNENDWFCPTCMDTGYRCGKSSSLGDDVCPDCKGNPDLYGYHVLTALRARVAELEVQNAAIISVCQQEKKHDHDQQSEYDAGWNNAMDAIIDHIEACVPSAKALAEVVKALQWECSAHSEPNKGVRCACRFCNALAKLDAAKGGK